MDVRYGTVAVSDSGWSLSVLSVEPRLFIVVVVYTWSATVMSAALQNVTVIKPRGVQQKLLNISKVDGQRSAVVRGVVWLSELWNGWADGGSTDCRTLSYFLKQLRRAGVLPAQLLYFYTGVIRPVLQYAAPVWNHLLTKTQIDHIEAIQRRALRITYSYTNDLPYISALYCAAIPSLADRPEQLSRKFLKINTGTLILPF